MYGLVIAHREAPSQFQWSSGTSDNFLSVEWDIPWTDEDKLVVDQDQKPVELYRELITALTHRQQWVLDICCGTGGFSFRVVIVQMFNTMSVINS